MTTVHLHQKPRKKSFLFISLAALFLLIVFINLFPPEKFWQILIFFILFSFFIFYLLFFILNFFRQALFISLGIILFTALRAVDLKHWLYPLLIIAIIVVIEVYFYNKDKS